VAHYSSHYDCYGDGAKNPLKSIYFTFWFLLHTPSLGWWLKGMNCWALIMAY